MVVYIGVTTMGNVTVQPTTADADTTYIAAGVGGAGGLLIVALAFAVGVVIVMRYKDSKKGKHNCVLLVNSAFNIYRWAEI